MSLDARHNRFKHEGMLALRRNVPTLEGTDRGARWLRTRHCSLQHTHPHTDRAEHAAKTGAVCDGCSFCCCSQHNPPLFWLLWLALDSC